MTEPERTLGDHRGRAARRPRPAAASRRTAIASRSIRCCWRRRCRPGPASACSMSAPASARRRSAWPGASRGCQVRGIELQRDLRAAGRARTSPPTASAARVEVMVGDLLRAAAAAGAELLRPRDGQSALPASASAATPLAASPAAPRRHVEGEADLADWMRFCLRMAAAEGHGHPDPPRRPAGRRCWRRCAGGPARSSCFRSGPRQAAGRASA